MESVLIVTQTRARVRLNCQNRRLETYRSCEERTLSVGRQVLMRCLVERGVMQPKGIVANLSSTFRRTLCGTRDSVACVRFWRLSELRASLRASSFASLRRPSRARARLLRGTLDLLGMQNIMVGVGTEGGSLRYVDSFSASAECYIPSDKSADNAMMSGAFLTRLLSFSIGVSDMEWVSRRDGCLGFSARTHLERLVYGCTDRDRDFFGSFFSWNIAGLFFGNEEDTLSRDPSSLSSQTRTFESQSVALEGKAQSELELPRCRAREARSRRRPAETRFVSGETSFFGDPLLQCSYVHFHRSALDASRVQRGRGRHHDVAAHLVDEGRRDLPPRQRGPPAAAPRYRLSNSTFRVF